MKQLILIRHSKSDWNIPLQDKDRPLTIRGINDAHLVSNKITELLPKTFVIWSSTAKRASETAIVFTQNLLCPLESIIYKEELYTFELKELEKSIQSINNSHDCVIIFGHNNALTNFVNKYGNQPLENVPTSGVVSMNFDISDWKNIKEGKITNTLFPKNFRT